MVANNAESERAEKEKTEKMATFRGFYRVGSSSYQHSEQYKSKDGTSKKFKKWLNLGLLVHLRGGTWYSVRSAYYGKCKKMAISSQ